MQTADELRDLAMQIENVTLQSPAFTVAMTIVRNCVDHLNFLARMHELNDGMPHAPGYGD